MAGKFMRVKKIVIPALTMIVIASQLMGCSVMSQDDTKSFIQKNEAIEIEVSKPKNEEQGKEVKTLDWTPLASLTTYQDTLRTPMETALNIVTDETNGKTGCLYQNTTGSNEQNNTLKEALQNQSFRAALENEETLNKLSQAALDTYADLDSDDTTTNAYMAINGYFNLLPDNTPNYANPSSTLTRAEFMSIVFRAETPVDSELIKSTDKDFKNAIGKNKDTDKFDAYAQHLTDSSYLDIASKSLNNLTYSGTITRAEAIYMLMAQYYPEELQSLPEEVTSIKLEDVKDGGDIIKTQSLKDKGDYNKADAIRYMLYNTEDGLDTTLYRALQLAVSKGIIDTETRYDEGITKEEAIEFIINTYTTFEILGKYEEKLADGTIINTPVDTDIHDTAQQSSDEQLDAEIESAMSEFDKVMAEAEADGVITDEEWGAIFNAADQGAELHAQKEQDAYNAKQEAGTLTEADVEAMARGQIQLTKEERERREADGFREGTVITREDGTSYLVLDNGRIVNPGEVVPGDAVWRGNEIDSQKLNEKHAQQLREASLID